jgi:isochorismate pyruvate lyase
MQSVIRCNSLEEVHLHVDEIDYEIVQLLAERGSYVKQAARFKSSRAEVWIPQRNERVLAKVKDLALQLGANPEVTEQVYRALLSAFIAAEMEEYRHLQNEFPAMT